MDPYLSIALGVVGCFAAAFAIIKVLMKQHFKQAKEIEELKAANATRYRQEIEKKFTALEGNLTTLTVKLEVVRQELVKAQVKMHATDKLTAALTDELKTFEARKAQMDKIESEMKRINETFVLIRNKLKPNQGGT